MILRFVAFAASRSTECDGLGDHFQSCRHLGAICMQVHRDGLPKSVVSICRLVGTVQGHLRIIGPVPPDTVNLLMGIVLDDDCCKRSTTQYNMADVTSSHPVTNNQAKLTRSSRFDGSAAQVSVAMKQHKYDQIARSPGIPFFPLAVETFGRWSRRR
mmetsp:Transcript_21039/g.33744  ORF Transcript_21039/g.33744 Transcript_21039/m.33744 type:complete len:157 (-) Transcript_21039:45-515(-)